jgi:hypothetical protein
MMALAVPLFVLAAVGALLGQHDAPPAAASARTPVAVGSAAGADLVARVGYNAGWRGAALVDAVAYAYIESAFRPTAVSRTGCVGLWQICPPHPDDMDPQANAGHAFGKWRGCRGGSFACDWDPYDGGPGNPAWWTGRTLGQHAVQALPSGGA